VLLNGYKLTPFRPLLDKSDERKLAEENVYLKNNLGAVQQQARWAMFVLNGLLILLFTFMVHRVLGPIVALATLTYLVIDPTVAAHLPVVMTDLPVALLSGTSLLAAVVAFRSWRAPDLVWVAVCLGLTLATKHSAVITAVAVGLLGVLLAFVGPVTFGSRARRMGLVALVLVGAVVVLWSFYGFRYRDSVEVGDSSTALWPLRLKTCDLRYTNSCCMACLTGRCYQPHTSGDLPTRSGPG
jgi:hypothetical protein